MKILIMCMGFEPNPETTGGTSNVVDGTVVGQVPIWNEVTGQYEAGSVPVTDISGKEDTANKTTDVATFTASDIMFPTVKAVVTYFQQKLTESIFGAFINSLTAKATPVNADSISVVDSADGNKQKKVSLSAFKTFLNYVGIGTSASLLDVTLSNQAASAGTRNIANVDDTGKVVKQSWAVVDNTNRKTTKTGLDNLMVTILEEWKNSDGNSILQILNGQKVKFGGTTAFWEVDTAVTSDNAAIKINNNQSKGWKLVNHNGDEFFFVRTTTGALGVVWRQQQEFDFGLGFKKVHAQARIITTDTAAVWNNIVSISLAANQAVSIQVNHLQATNADGTRIAAYGNMNAIGRRDAANVTTVNVPAFTVLGATTENWRIAANDAVDSVTIDFLNTAGAGKLFTINLDYSYIIQNI